MTRPRPLSMPIALALLATPAVAQTGPATTRAVTLRVGDAAPSLAVDRWLKGEPVARFEPGTVYVVEFWATWCGPCRQAMPDLSWLQRKYPRVVFVGVNGMEKSAADVDAFMARHRHRMAYRVAADASPGEYAEGPMVRAWMTAAGVDGIPCSFLIDGRGRVAAITHPGALRPLLDAVLAGRPLPAERDDADDAALAPLWRAYDDANARHDWPAAGRALDAMEAIFARSRVAGSYQYPIRRQWLRIQSGNLAAAQAGFDELDRRAAADEIEPSTLDLADRQRLAMFAMRRDAGSMNALARRMAGRAAGDADRLNSLAWSLIGEPRGTGNHVDGIDLALVLDVATRAVAADPTDANVLDTLARVHALRGDFAAAVETESRAAGLAKSDRQRAAIEKCLADYRAGRVE